MQGGGSDLKEYYELKGGSVVSTALNKYIYVAVTEKFERKIRVAYSKVEYVDCAEEVKHDLVREALKMTNTKIDYKGIDIAYMSNMLPDHEGSGLGASSSLTVGLLNSFYNHNGKRVSRETLADQACKIEIDILGNPIGKQDQYAAAYGGFNFIKFHPNGRVSVEPIRMKEETKEKLSDNLLMFYTMEGLKSSAVLTEQKEKTKNNIATLDKMVELSERLRDSLENDDLTEFGNILHEGWVYKKTLASKITNPKIDEYYERARNVGAIGGKILGSGGGGFLLIYCEKEKQDDVRKELFGLREAKFDGCKFDPDGSRIIYDF